MSRVLEAHWLEAQQSILYDEAKNARSSLARDLTNYLTRQKRLEAHWHGTRKTRAQASQLPRGNLGFMIEHVSRFVCLSLL